MVMFAAAMTTTPLNRHLSYVAPAVVSRSGHTVSCASVTPVCLHPVQPASGKAGKGGHTLGPGIVGLGVGDTLGLGLAEGLGDGLGLIDGLAVGDGDGLLSQAIARLASLMQVCAR